MDSGIKNARILPFDVLTECFEVKDPSLSSPSLAEIASYLRAVQLCGDLDASVTAVLREVLIYSPNPIFRTKALSIVRLRKGALLLGAFVRAAPLVFGLRGRVKKVIEDFDDKPQVLGTRRFTGEGLERTLIALGLENGYAQLFHFATCNESTTETCIARERARCAITGYPTGPSGQIVHLIPHSMRLKTTNIPDKQNSAACISAVFLKLFCGDVIFNRLHELLDKDLPSNMLLLGRDMHNCFDSGGLILVPYTNTFLTTSDGTLRAYLTELHIQSSDVKGTTKNCPDVEGSAEVPPSHGMTLAIRTYSNGQPEVADPGLLCLSGLLWRLVHMSGLGVAATKRTALSVMDRRSPTPPSAMGFPSIEDDEEEEENDRKRRRTEGTGDGDGAGSSSAGAAKNEQQDNTEGKTMRGIDKSLEEPATLSVRSSFDSDGTRRTSSEFLRSNASTAASSISSLLSDTPTPRAGTNTIAATNSLESNPLAPPKHTISQTVPLHPKIPSITINDAPQSIDNTKDDLRTGVMTNMTDFLNADDFREPDSEDENVVAAEAVEMNEPRARKDFDCY